MLKYLCYASWALFSNVPMFVGLHLNLTERISRRVLKYIPVVVLCTAYLVFAIIFTTENNVMRVFFFISYLIYAVVAFSEKPSKTLVVASVLGALSFAVDLIVELPVYILSGKVLTPSDASVETILVCAIFGFLYMVTVLEFTIFNKRNEKMLDKTAILFFLMPVSNMLLILAVASAFNAPDFWTPLRSVLLSMGVLVMVISMYLLYRAMRENYRAKQTQIKLSQLEYNQKLSENYFENVTQSAQMLMKYKHDFNNMINTALHMVNSSDRFTKQEGVRLLEQIRDKNNATVIPVYCTNAVVNTILYDKAEKARSEGADFSFEVKLPEKLDIELTDLCSVFTNLIDNGIMSACVSQDNRLELKAWCDMGFMFVKTTNYPDADAKLPEEKKDFDITSISSHGYGLTILNDIAEKYCGSFEIKQQQGSVETLCCVGVSSEGNS